MCNIKLTGEEADILTTSICDTIDACEIDGNTDVADVLRGIIAKLAIAERGVDK